VTDVNTSATDAYSWLSYLCLQAPFPSLMNSVTVRWSLCANLPRFSKFMQVAGLTACGDATSSRRQSVYDAWEVVTEELLMHFLL